MFGMAIWESNAQALAESQVKAQQGGNIQELHRIQNSGTSTSETHANISSPVVSAICLILFCLFVSPYSIQATGFKITGMMSSQQYTTSNHVVLKCWDFEVSVLTNQWLLKLFSTNGQVNTFGCDGRDVYSLLQDPTAKKRLKLSSYVGAVSGGAYPLQSPYISTVLPWLAYCSSTYMASNVANGEVVLPAPWLSAWAMPLAHIYSAHYEPIEGGFGLPMRLEYTPNRKRMEELKQGVYHTLAKPTDTARDRAATQIASYYMNIVGSEAVYQVLQTTNVQGLVLPARFEFDNYGFKKTTKTSKERRRYLRQKMVGELTSVDLIEDLNPLPTSSDEITSINVADYRFADPDSAVNVVFVGYTARNSEWITNKLDARLQDRYARELRSHDQVIKLPKPIIVLFLTAIFLIPPFFILRRSRKERA